MPRLAEHFVARVRDAADIVAIIGRHVPLKRTGADFTALCPFHQEKTPSFTVSAKKKIFHCFGCERGGDIFKFLCELKQIEFVEAVKLLAQELGIPIEYEDQPKPKPTKVEIEMAVPAATLSPRKEGESPTPLERFYGELTLTEADRKELREKRGLSESLIERMGYRTNRAENRAILEALAGEYSIDELVRCGLWKRGDKRKPGHAAARPTGQFYGWGTVRKRTEQEVESEDTDFEDIDTGEWIWARKETGECNPMLIPYWNADGHLIALRPHRGFPKGQKPHLYVCQTSKGSRAVFTEGEFKAGALADVCTDLSIASVPGIQMVKNFHVWSDILEWIRLASPREILIAFDSEEHGNPGLPGFKAEIEKRFEAQVWARVLAERLQREDQRVRIAMLPENWRNGSGKADWDSALAQLRRKHADDAKAEAAIRREFEEVLARGLRAWEFRQMHLFSDEAEGIIADRAALFSYEPALPWGGKKQQRLAKELRVLAARLQRAEGDEKESAVNRSLAARLVSQAELYESTWGWYHVMKLSLTTREKLQAGLNAAKTQDQVTAFKALLEGSAQLVAPFRMRPFYVLLKPNGECDRLVSLRNVRGEGSGLIALPAHDFTAPRDWSEFLVRHGNYNWEAGSTELQMLQRDTNFVLARRTVKQLVCYGCEQPGQLWFFEDCALDDGVEVRPDREGIFWHQRRGHTFVRAPEGLPVGDENQVFRLNEYPRMHPELTLECGADRAFKLVERHGDDREATRLLLGELATRLHDSFAAHDGWLLLGAMLAWAAAPEIYKLRGEFPGIFIVGEKGSGKTVAAKVGMALWGYARLDQPMSFKASTTVNAIITLGQSANMPVWGDEYKEGQLKEEGIRNIIHCGFNREIPGKWSPDGTTRKVRSNWLVTGESMCANASTMDRFITIVTAKEHWKGTQEERQERFEWFLEMRPFFFSVVRTLLRHRKTYVGEVMRVLGEWERLAELSAAEPRGKFSHGVAFASLCAVNSLLPVVPVSRFQEFKDWTVQRALTASREVQQMVNVNQFWQDLIAAAKSDAFGRTPAELRKIFKVRVNDKAAPPPGVTPEQLRLGGERTRYAWKSYLLYLQPGPVIDMLRQHLHRSGQKLALSQMDLRRQMESRLWWVRPPKGYTMHKAKFGGSNGNCWCIEVDKMSEIGFNPVSDPEFKESTEDVNVLTTEWVDPRKGDLFYLIDILEQKDEQREA